MRVKDTVNFLLTSDWQRVFIDEFEDICPEHSSGKTWKKNKKLINTVKLFRKGRVNLIVKRQSNIDVDRRVRKKIPIV